jgi:hypothetical protein
VLKLPSEQILTSFFSTLAAGGAADSSSGAPTTGAPTETVAAGQVTVSVLNGSGVTGAAATAATALAQAGFRASSGGNATRTATTTIGYHSGDDATAATLAAKARGAALTVDNSVAAGHLTLTLGTDFQGIGQPVTAATAGASDTTTVPGAYANKERTAADTSCID